MGPFLVGARAVSRDRPERAGPGGQIAIEISDLYNLQDLTAAFPVHRLTGLAGRRGQGRPPWTASRPPARCMSTRTATTHGRPYEEGTRASSVDRTTRSAAD
jgi:hypothetical protein